MNPSTTSRQYRHAKIAIVALSLTAVANASCSKQGPSKDETLSGANNAFAAGQYADAEKGYREVLRLSPTDPVAVRQLGIIYQDQGQLLAAYPLLKKAAELEPDNVEVQLKLGRIYASAGDAKEARAAALRILDKQPTNDHALILLADTAVTPNDLDEVQKLLEGLREKDQDRAAYHVALGTLAARQRDGARAEDEYRAAIKLDPKLAEAHMALGNLYWSRNDLKSAEEEFKTAADISQPRSLARVRYAEFLLKAGKNAEAKNLLNEIVGKVPDYLPPRVDLMKIACTERGDEDCTKRIQSVLAQDPINYDALYEDGSLSAAKGETSKAIREFEFLSNTYSQNAQVRYQAALAYLLSAKGAGPAEAKRAVENAENRLTEAVKLAPNFAQAVTLLSDLKIKKGVPAAAVELLTPLIKAQPQNVQAHYLLATAYLAQQQTTQALTVFRQMTELFPKDPQPPYLVGAILLAQRQPAEARQAFEKSLEISPDFLPATEQLVELDLADKQYASALDRVQKLIDKDPKQAQAWAIRGKIYLSQRDFVHAEPDLLKAIELDPALEPAYLLLTQLYVATNRQEQAIEKLNGFVKENKDNQAKAAPALMQLAMLQQSLKHFNDARDTYEKVLTLAPNQALALNNLAVLYSDTPGQLDKAYDIAKKAREAAPNVPNIADTLGWILYRKGDYGNALPLLQESAGKLPDAPQIQFHLGMAQYMLGSNEPARVALQKAADAAVDFPDKDVARRRLAMLAIDVQAANTADVKTKLENYLHDQPNDPQALLRLGQVQEHEGASDQAVKTYEKIVSGNSEFAPAVRRLAILYSQRPNDEAKALDLATKARQVYPDDPELAKALAVLNYRRGLYPQSVELLKSAATKSKDDVELLYYLGQTQHQLKQWSDCKDTLQRANNLGLSAKLADDAKSALADCVVEDDRSKGIASYRAGDFAQSAKLLAEAAAERKNDPELLYYLGQSYRQLKQLNECTDALQRALSLSLPPQLTDEAKRALGDCASTTAPR
jgi:tetratricopeptide (TPR) repeat protein